MRAQIAVRLCWRTWERRKNCIMTVQQVKIDRFLRNNDDEEEEEGGENAHAMLLCRS